MRWWLDTRNKPALLWAFLHQFEGRGSVSFEGNLRHLGILELPGAKYEETSLLKRQNGPPPEDFVIVPISAETIASLKRSLNAPGIFNSAGAVCHVQIEYQERVVLGAHDNFHRECIFAQDPVPQSFLDKLVAAGVIRSYEQGPIDNPGGGSA
jgi:hypothetical protein